MNSQKVLKRGIGFFLVATLLCYCLYAELEWIIGLYLITGFYCCLLLISTGDIKKFSNPNIAHLLTFLLGPPRGLISWFKD